jgi:hypothetical protein
MLTQRAQNLRTDARGAAAIEVGLQVRRVAALNVRRGTGPHAPAEALRATAPGLTLVGDELADAPRQLIETLGLFFDP